MSYSYSSLAQYKRCPLAYKLRFVDKLVPRQDARRVHHLKFGQAAHAALAALYRGDYAGLGPDARRELVDHAVQVFETEYPRQLDEADRAKTRANGALALRRYAERWAEEDHTWRILQVESANRLDEGFVTHLDMVIEDQFGGIYGVDHKFVGGKRCYLAEDFWEEFAIDSQISIYISQIERAYGRCDGFYINAIGMVFTDKPKLFKLGDPEALKWSVQQERESETTYQRKNYGPSHIAAYGLNPRFGRTMFHRTAEQLESEADSNLYWISRIKDSVAMNLWGFNTDGCKFCEYKPICSAGREFPRDWPLIESDFRQVCGQETPNLRQCQLDSDHQGEHSEEYVSAEREIEWEV